MRRLLGFLMVGLLFAGTAAACSSDDDGGDTTTTAADSGGGSTDTTAADSGDSGGGGNEAITAFCDSVQEFVDASEALAADPTDTDAQNTVSELGAQLGTDLTELSGQAGTFTEDDLAQFQECQTDFTSAQG